MSRSRLLIGLMAGVAVFAGISMYADIDKLGAELLGFHWLAFAGALGLALVNYVIRFGRWQLYLRRRDIDLPRGQSALVFLSGFALSITPGKVGEFIKSFLLRDLIGTPVSRSAPIVLAERITDLTALLLVGAMGVFVYNIAQTMVAVGVALVLGGLVVLSWPKLARLLIDALTKPRITTRFRERLHAFYDGVADLLRPAPLAWGTGLGIVAWMAECLGFALILAAFPGTDVPIGLATLIYAATTVAGALSFLPGGLLVTEGAMIVLLVESSAAVSEPTAAAATILIRLATLWFAVAIGLIALAAVRRRVASRLRAEPPRNSLDENVPP